VETVASVGINQFQAYHIQSIEGQTMTNKQIRELYDANPNMTLRELERITGLDIASLKLILMTEG